MDPDAPTSRRFMGRAVFIIATPVPRKQALRTLLSGHSYVSRRPPGSQPKWESEASQYGQTFAETPPRAGESPLVHPLPGQLCRPAPMLVDSCGIACHVGTTSDFKGL